MSDEYEAEGIANSESAWFAVQFKPNSHKIAERNLTRQGFEAFLPTFTQTVKRANAFREARVPLFPGYMFALVDSSTHSWRTINSTYGVSKLVTFGDQKPASVPFALIEALRHIGNVGLDQPAYEVGDTVHITNGPFANFITQIVGLVPEQRVWVLLDVLGKATRVAVGTDSLVKL